MFEIREWIGSRKIVVVDGLPNLEKAFIKRARLMKKEPKKIYSIFRSPKNKEERKWKGVIVVTNR